MIAGLDGAGKSTLAAALRERLAGRGLRCSVHKVPLFGNPAYERYRGTMDRMMTAAPEAARAARGALILLETVRFVEEDVLPAVERDDVVICDRYVESTRCYLLARRLIAPGVDRVTAALPAPDLAFLLDLPVADSLRRLEALGEPTSVDKQEFLERMHELLRAWAERSGAAPVDARAPAGDVLLVVSGAVERRLAAGAGGSARDP